MRVFYRSRMVADTEGYSPSARKPLQVIANWKELGFDFEIVKPEPATMEQLCAAHDPHFVNSILDCEEPNGFGTYSESVARSLPYTSGSMIAAAEYVLDENVPIACSPTSGFHHAHYASAEGFCTFNGLMITAMHLINTRRVKKVGILDLDMHYGDGTDDILRRTKSYFTIMNSTHEKDIQRNPLNNWRSMVSKFDKWEVEIVLYQAGADAHILDPLGGYLTTSQMLKRDAEVFRACKEFGLPVVWNLAGGYQRDEKGGIDPVLELHANTFRAAKEVFS